MASPESSSLLLYVGKFLAIVGAPVAVIAGVYLLPATLGGLNITSIGALVPNGFYLNPFLYMNILTGGWALIGLAHLRQNRNIDGSYKDGAGGTPLIAPPSEPVPILQDGDSHTEVWVPLFLVGTLLNIVTSLILFMPSAVIDYGLDPSFVYLTPLFIVYTSAANLAQYLYAETGEYPTGMFPLWFTIPPLGPVLSVIFIRSQPDDILSFRLLLERGSEYLQMISDALLPRLRVSDFVLYSLLLPNIILAMIAVKIGISALFLPVLGLIGHPYDVSSLYLPVIVLLPFSIGWVLLPLTLYIDSWVQKRIHSEIWRRDYLSTILSMIPFCGVIYVALYIIRRNECRKHQNRVDHGYDTPDRRQPNFSYKK